MKWLTVVYLPELTGKNEALALLRKKNEHHEASMEMLEAVLPGDEEPRRFERGEEYE